MRRKALPLQALTHRLAQCPADFLAEPKTKAGGLVRVNAVVSDLLVDLGGEPLTEGEALPLAEAPPQRGDALRLTLVACWLLGDPWFRDRNLSAPAKAWLLGGLEHLAKLVKPDLFVRDPDRREELARLGLKALDLLPEGETAHQAADRLTSLDSVERQKVLQATKAAEAHARKLREAMARKAAEEAAAKYTGE